MTNNEFDEKISNIVSEETLPFNEGNWVRMQQKLDKTRNHKFIVMPFLYKSYAAGLFLMIATAYYFYSQQRDEVINKAISNIDQLNFGKEEYPTKQTNQVNTSAKSITPILAKNTKRKNAATEFNKDEIVFDNVVDTNTSVKTSVVANAKNNFGKNEQPKTVLPFENYDPVLKQRRITFGINTGMALYQSYNSFAAGLTIKNKVTKNISIQTGLGFVQGHQNITVKHVIITETPVIIPSDTGQTPTMHKTISESFEEYSRNLPYIQFNPGISIQIYKRLHGVVGIDIQRIVINTSTLDSINQHLAVTGKKVPQTDAGITLNMSYLITRNIGVGISYRNSLAGKAKDNTEYIKRNYSLIQVQYLFNRR